MIASKLFFGLFIVAYSTAQNKDLEKMLDEKHFIDFDEEDPFFDTVNESHNFGKMARARLPRQVGELLALNPAGNYAKVRIVVKKKNVLNAVESVVLDKMLQPISRGIGMALDNVKMVRVSFISNPFLDRSSTTGNLNAFHHLSSSAVNFPSGFKNIVTPYT